ncbi:hypothetical protein [Aeromonas phage 65.2]|uniref:Uncharacterized protein n=1 Tax=Aeromonas phage 65.2 TaxID=1932896 RepID=A0A219YC98_9CAUD|nr:hypothetical protein [Aeromonas phage 65.2]
MKIKFKSECSMKNFMTHGMDSGDYNHNKAMVETYQSLPFHVDVKGHGWENEEFYISPDEYDFFEIISES